MGCEKDQAVPCGPRSNDIPTKIIANLVSTLQYENVAMKKKLGANMITILMRVSECGENMPSYKET